MGRIGTCSILCLSLLFLLPLKIQEDGKIFEGDEDVQNYFGSNANGYYYIHNSEILELSRTWDMTVIHVQAHDPGSTDPCVLSESCSKN